MSIESYLVFVMTIITPAESEHVLTTLKYSSRYRVKPTVVNGITAESGETPYVVSIKEPQIEIGQVEKYWSNLCGGAIFGENLVLTAAHCFEENDFIYAKRPQTLRVVAGALKNHLRREKLFNTHDQWRSISKVIIHEYFHFPNNDIAILFLRYPWKYSTTVHSVALAARSKDHFRECWTAGYGRVGYEVGDQVSEELLIGRVRTMPSWQCTTFWEMNMDKFICSDSTISDVSQGDSGSPMVCTAVSSNNNHPIVEGIVCGKNFDKTTLYTRVSSFHDWISKNMASKTRKRYIMLIITMFLTN